MSATSPAMLFPKILVCSDGSPDSEGAVKAALQLARQILSKKKHENKQIFMITDGKPSCIKEGLKLYKNPFGLDRKIVNQTLREAVQCRKEKIEITTFMAKI